MSVAPNPEPREEVDANNKPLLDAMKDPGTANSARSHVVPGLDGPPNPAVAIGAVQSTSPSRCPFGGAVALIARHGPL
jgi:hypothetical protein